jgi:glycosyltransferase involved in cell wall biosynthesis
VWKSRLEETGIHLVLTIGARDAPRGVGYGKNRAIERSHGMYLCFLDVDDYMEPARIRLQLEECQLHSNVIVGCRIKRVPENSTPRYSTWINEMTQDQLVHQRFKEVTVVMPTWFVRRDWFSSVGEFDEGYKTPEDMLFFYEHLRHGGGLARVDHVLLNYRFGSGISLGIHRKTLLKIRLGEMERDVLCKWKTFTIWSAGRDGREFYCNLTPENREKVSFFCDVDKNKIGTDYIHMYIRKPIPIIHYSEARPPVVICKKPMLTHGEFEGYLDEMVTRHGWVEGIDYYFFS